MKKYNIYSLKVVKVSSGDNVRYLICKYNELTDTYVEIFTNYKLKIKDKNFVEPLSDYYSLLAQCNYTTGEPLMLEKKDLLEKCLDINIELNLKRNEVKVEKDNIYNHIDINNILEKATLAFFPKNGAWHNSCFQRSNILDIRNLPCHLRDNIWLAKMLKKDQNLFYISFSEVLDFVKTSSLFKEKRHEYELEIVKWQIKWIAGRGENWICDENYGGEFIFLTPVVDLGVRKGVVDTLIQIGMNKDVVEEGLEKYADLWRERFMVSAFRNKYEPILCLFRSQLEPINEEHKEKWLKMRRYEYYQRHKKSVDLYGVVTPDMLMNEEEFEKLKRYLEQKHQERMAHIEEVKNSGYENMGQGITLKKYFKP